MRLLYNEYDFLRPSSGTRFGYTFLVFSIIIHRRQQQRQPIKSSFIRNHAYKYHLCPLSPSYFSHYPTRNTKHILHSFLIHYLSCLVQSIGLFCATLYVYYLYPFMQYATISCVFRWESISVSKHVCIAKLNCVVVQQVIVFVKVKVKVLCKQYTNLSQDELSTACRSIGRAWGYRAEETNSQHAE